MSLIEALSASLRGSAPASVAGDDFEPRDLGEGRAASTPAAVLVAVVDRPEPGVILTVRTSTLRHHPGQIAFPGGRIELGETPKQAALREAREEVGLDPRSVEIVGTGDRYLTVTGFAITPVIAVVPPDLALVPSDGEVAELFEAPLGFVLDPANQVRRTAEWQGRPRTYWEIAWGSRRIWGATAGIIVNLSRGLELVA